MLNRGVRLDTLSETISPCNPLPLKSSSSSEVKFQLSTLNKRYMRTKMVFQKSFSGGCIGANYSRRKAILNPINMCNHSPDLSRYSEDDIASLMWLLNAWDPIGVLPFEWGPEDEYDCFLYPILSILHDDKGIDALNDFLQDHLTNHMGLSVSEEQTKRVSLRIMEWWNSKV